MRLPEHVRSNSSRNGYAISVKNRSASGVESLLIWLRLLGRYERGGRGSVAYHPPGVQRQVSALLMDRTQGSASASIGFRISGFTRKCRTKTLGGRAMHPIPFRQAYACEQVRPAIQEREALDTMDAVRWAFWR